MSPTAPSKPCPDLNKAGQTYLHWGSAVVSCTLPDLLQNIADIVALSLAPAVIPLALEVLDHLDILVLLLGPVAGHIAHADLLALVYEDGAAEGGVEHGDHLGRLRTLRRVVARDSRDHARLVVVLQATRISPVRKAIEIQAY